MKEIEKIKQQKIEEAKNRAIEKEKEIENSIINGKILEEKKKQNILTKILSHEEKVKEIEEQKKKEIQEKA